LHSPHDSKGLVVGFASASLFFFFFFISPPFPDVLVFYFRSGRPLARRAGAFVDGCWHPYNDPLHVIGGAFFFSSPGHLARQTQTAALKLFEKRYLRARIRSSKSPAPPKPMATSFIITPSRIPGTILGVLAVNATFGGPENRSDAAKIIGGILSVRPLWWLLLTARFLMSEGNLRNTALCFSIESRLAYWPLRPYGCLPWV
jgi:hypothetical protein